MTFRRTVRLISAAAALAVVGAGCVREQPASVVVSDTAASHGAGTTTTTYVPLSYMAGPAECPDIEAFAMTLTDTGISVDYQPSSSPAGLTAMVDVAVAGHLTGSATEIAGTRGDYYHVYEVAVDEVVAGEGVATGDVIAVHQAFNPVRAPGWEPASTSVPAGAPVAVFASWYDDVNGLYLAQEGMTLSCSDGPRLGMTGAYPGWLGLATVDDVVSAARADQ